MDVCRELYYDGVVRKRLVSFVSSNSSQKLEKLLQLNEDSDNTTGFEDMENFIEPEADKS